MSGIEGELRLEPLLCVVWSEGLKLVVEVEVRGGPFVVVEMLSFEPLDFLLKIFIMPADEQTCLRTLFTSCSK